MGPSLQPLSSSHSSSPPCIYSPSISKSLPRTSPYLPPELTDYILDYCHDDKHTLFTCSLVSRSFNVTCRYHIFGKGFDISNTPEVQGKRNVSEDAQMNSMNKEHKNQDPGPEVVSGFNSINYASRAASFVRIVLSPSSTVAPFLQELSLIVRPLSFYSSPTTRSADAWLDELLALLPATRTISFPSQALSSPAPRTSSPLQSPFHLRTLRIFRHGTDLSPFSRLALHQNFANTVTKLALFETTLQKRSLKRDMEWVCGFEKLEDLLFYGHHRGEQWIRRDGATGDTDNRDLPWGRTHPELTFDLNDDLDAVDAQGRTTIRLPQSIRRLRLDLPGSALEAVMRWLLAHAFGYGLSQANSSNEVQKNLGVGNFQAKENEGIPCVSTLHIFRVMQNEAPALRAYLRACKDTLEDLMMFLYQSSTNRDDFDLSTQTVLRSLYLASNGSRPMKVLHDILSTLSTQPSLIQQHKIYLQIPRWQLASDSDAWDSLDTILNALLESSIPTSNSRKWHVSAIVDGHHNDRNGSGEDDRLALDKLRERLPLSTSFIWPSLSSASCPNKAGKFTMISHGAKEVTEYLRWLDVLNFNSIKYQKRNRKQGIRACL
ncbi:hypothetical protein F5890DRAFT_214323 [Lentinula detonsa]|uniref:F-box domain-containing protein n=1 Tax=Lentinula detonsa TaxID=2804962 RepID=A0AA38UXA2_9AGAR|nr:hypothetical protein F5890DRAFT_214323 [Lentinula detonsa]